MTVVCEVVFAAPHAPPDAALPNALAAIVARTGGTPPGLLTLDLYTPDDGAAHDPYVQDGRASGPLAMLAFASLDALDDAVNAPGFAAMLAASEPAILACTAMRRSNHAVAGEAAPAALAAKFSYVVRYHRPAADEGLFARHYVETHPPLLGRLPGIRNVMCYVPLPWRHAGGLPSIDYLVGNEVVFDHRDAFNHAMASPVRHALRAHAKEFPAYCGRNTHFAMHRARLFG